MANIYSVQRWCTGTILPREASHMPTYITLYTLTDQAIRAVKIAPKRIDKAIKNFEEIGGKLIGLYTTMEE